MERKIFKNILMICLLILTVCFMTACGEKTFVLGEKATIEDFAEITPINVLVDDDEVSPPKQKEGGVSQLIGGDSSAATVIAVMKVKNLTQTNLNINDLGSFVVAQGDQQSETYDVALLTGGGTALKHSADIAKGQEGIVYFMADISKESRGEATLTFQLGEKATVYTMECDTTKAVANSEPVKKGEAITADGYGEITLNSVEFSKVVKASKASKDKGYVYHEPGDNKIFIDGQVTVKNLGTKKIKASELIGAMAAFEGETYDLWNFEAETADSKDLAGYAKLKPGESRNVHLILEVPKELKGSKGEINLFFNDKVYAYSL